MHLYSKLSYYGINGNTLKWIKNFLQGRTQQVIVEGHHSNSINVTSGVPQGTVLAPLLFLCYINDLPTNINSYIKLYADDVLIYRPIRSLDDCKILQEDLNAIDQWAVHWQARFNPDKCEHIRITNSKNPIFSTYFIQNTLIQTVPNVTYLGVTINEHLSWSNHITNITKKANATRGFLQRNISSCPSSIKEICYKLMIRPIIEYASTIWAPHLQNEILKLESIQRKSARFVLNDYARLSSVTSMLQKLGWPTLEQRRNNSKIIMLYKIIHNVVHIDYSDVLIEKTNCTRGHSQRFHVPLTRINAYHYSFFPSAIRKWNILPDCIISSPNIDLFISNYYKHCS